MMKHSLFEYLDYRQYLIDILEEQSKTVKASKTRLAAALNCQLPFISQVLSGEKDLSLEQIQKLSEHFDFSEEEANYMIDLLSYCRAGTEALKSIFLNRLKKGKLEHDQKVMELKESQVLTLEDQVQYYSSWHYPALHVATTIPELQSIDALKQYFKLTDVEVETVLGFLLRKGIVKNTEGRIQAEQKRIYVDGRQPIVTHHHAIWRNKILHDLKKQKDEDIHFTLCFSATEDDFKLLRERLLQVIAENIKTIRASKEEKLGLFCIDLQGI